MSSEKETAVAEGETQAPSTESVVKEASPDPELEAILADFETEQTAQDEPEIPEEAPLEDDSTPEGEAKEDVKEEDAKEEVERLRRETARFEGNAKEHQRTLDRLSKLPEDQRAIVQKLLSGEMTLETLARGLMDSGQQKPKTESDWDPDATEKHHQELREKPGHWAVRAAAETLRHYYPDIEKRILGEAEKRFEQKMEAKLKDLRAHYEEAATEKTRSEIREYAGKYGIDFEKARPDLDRLLADKKNHLAVFESEKFSPSEALIRLYKMERGVQATEDAKKTAKASVAARPGSSVGVGLALPDPMSVDGPMEAKIAQGMKNALILAKRESQSE